MGGTAARDQPEVCVLITDARVLGDKGHIACHHELHSPGQGVAVHHGDGGNGHCLQGEECVVEVFDVIGHQGQVVENLVEIQQVGSGAKPAAFAAHHQRLDGRVIANGSDCVGELGEKVRVEGVEGVRSVETERGDAVSHRKRNVAILHSISRQIATVHMAVGAHTIPDPLSRD